MRADTLCFKLVTERANVFATTPVSEHLAAYPIVIIPELSAVDTNGSIRLAAWNSLHENVTIASVTLTIMQETNVTQNATITAPLNVTLTATFTNNDTKTLTATPTANATVTTEFNVTMPNRKFAINGSWPIGAGRIRDDINGSIAEQLQEGEDLSEIEKVYIELIDENDLIVGAYYPRVETTETATRASYGVGSMNIMGLIAALTFGIVLIIPRFMKYHEYDREQG